MKLNACLKKYAGFLIFILCGLFVSCDVAWHADLRSDLWNETRTKINFYSDKEENLAAGETPRVTSRSYMTGTKVTSGDLPGSSDSEIAAWNPGFKVGGWRFYRSTVSQDAFDEDLFSEYIITADEIDVYAEWHARYVVIYNYQTVDGNAYDSVPEIR